MLTAEERATEVIDRLKQAMFRQELQSERVMVRLADVPLNTRYLTVKDELGKTDDMLKGRLIPANHAKNNDEDYLAAIGTHYRNMKDLAASPPVRREYLAALRSQLETGVIQEPVARHPMAVNRDQIHTTLLSKKWQAMRNPHIMHASVVAIVDGFFAGKLEGIRDPAPLLRKTLREREKEQLPPSKAHEERDQREAEIDRLKWSLQDVYHTLPNDATRELSAAALLQYATQKRASTYYAVEYFARTLKESGKYPDAVWNDATSKGLNIITSSIENDFSNLHPSTFRRHMRNFVAAISESGYLGAIQRDEELNALLAANMPKASQRSGWSI